jgi:hypothetical protein
MLAETRYRLRLPIFCRRTSCPPLPLDQKSLGVWIIDLALNKSRRNREGGEFRWKIVRSRNGGVCPKSDRRTDLCVVGAHISKLGISVAHIDRLYSELSG